MSAPSLSSIKKRILPMLIIVIVCMAALVLRLVYWQVIRGEELSVKVKNQQTGSSVITASRGKIYDRNGKSLAESVSASTLVCNPQDVEEFGDAAVIARELSQVLDIEYQKLYENLTKDNRYQVLKKRMSVDEAEAVKNLMNTETNKEIADKLKGVYFEDDSKRYYPFTIAPHILGFTGYDNNGLQGIELTFDDELSGKDGSIEQNQTAGGATLEDQQAEYLTAQLKGSDVVLTIDETIQHFLENHLERAVTENKLKEGAAGIVMNPKTGEILAMATKPDFDGNNPYDVEAFNEFVKQYEEPESNESDDPEATPVPTENPFKLSDERISELRNRMWRNKAISDSYEPGSTFKIITAAAALEEHAVELDSQFYCPGFKIVADRNIGCASKVGHGPESFVEGVQNSCNPVFMEVAEKLGSDKFMEYFTAFGLTEKTNIELVGESSSIYYKDGMSEVDLATSSFGQGFQVTPIQLITAISAVINGGERMKPQIVKEIRNDNGIVKSYAPEVVNRVISEETSEKMRNILEKVVSDPNATGKNAYVKGCRIGGKTGTSEKNPRGSDKRIASFVGFAPANDPEIICLVVLDEPQIDNRYGGSIAAPLAGQIIEDVLNYLGSDKQYSEDEEPIVKAEVPDIRERELSEAEDMLEAVKLNYVIKGDGNKIIKQLPEPGTMLNTDSIVVIYTERTSSEEELVTVPNLKGTSVGVAKETLNSVYLNFEVAGAGHSETSLAFCVNQSIEPGEKVEQGTVIGVEFRQDAQD